MWDWLTDVFESFFGNPSQAWDRFKNGRSNEINADIASQNLGYQRERNEIEDARYAEETAYNRQWAEEERAYNRALQQQLFEREDTSMSRQAADLASIGINPLSANMSGANAGQAVTSATPSTPSARGGSALHNDFKMQDQGMLGILSSLSGLADTINGISTGQYTRDSLALQNDAQFLQNLKDAHDLGFTNYKVGAIKRGAGSSKWESTMSDDENFNDSKGSYFIPGAKANREYNHMKYANLYDSDSPQGRLIKDLGNLDFVKLAENILTRGAKVIDNIGDKFKKDYGTESELKKFFSLFY